MEDDEDLRNLLNLSVERLGYRSSLAADGREALQRFEEEEIDLVILDIMLPHVSGIDVCNTIRKSSDVPILMLTALDNSDDIAHLLSIGADEYVTKPFSFQVLAAHINALLRRISWIQTRPQLMVITAGDITLDIQGQTVSVEGGNVHLTDNEVNLLAHLMHNVEITCSSESLYAAVWGVQRSVGSTALETTIRRLRMKIEENPSQPRWIQTLKGHGYKFTLNEVDDEQPRPTNIRPVHTYPTVGDFQLDPSLRQISVAGRIVRLSEIDYQILTHFLAHPGEIVDRPSLLAKVWQHRSQASEKLAIAAIQRLRQKIEEEPSKPKYIRTIPNKGYCFVPTGKDEQ